jgi:hypothetical protein
LLLAKDGGRVGYLVAEQGKSGVYVADKVP